MFQNTHRPEVRRVTVDWFMDETACFLHQGTARRIWRAERAKNCKDRPRTRNRVANVTGWAAIMVPGDAATFSIDGKAVPGMTQYCRGALVKRQMNGWAVGINGGYEDGDLATDG
jgi:hypothetical protein